MRLTIVVYGLSSTFPRNEQFRLSDQLLRAVASVPANIAEGNGRGTRKDYAHFLSIAKGSLAETETFLLLAVELGFTNSSAAAEAFGLIEEVSKMLVSIRRHLLADS